MAEVGVGDHGSRGAEVRTRYGGGYKYSKVGVVRGTTEAKETTETAASGRKRVTEEKSARGPTGENI